MAAYSVLETLAVRLVGHTTAYTNSLDAAVRHTNTSLNIIESRVSRLGRSFMSLGSIVTLGLTAAVTGLGAVSGREFLQFDHIMTTSTAVMGDVSDAARDMMEATADAISSETMTRPTQLAHSYFVLASAGYSASEAIGAIAVAERFATAGAFDMESGVQGAISSLYAMRKVTSLLLDAQSALGLRSKDNAENIRNMTRVSDTLVKANAIANATVQEFAESLTNKGGAALRTVNKDVEEGVAVLAAYAQQGTKGAGAGEKLNIVIRDLQRSAIRNADEWNALGVSVFDTTGKMLPLADIIQELETAFKGMSDEEKRASFIQLGFQDRSLAATIQLLGMSRAIREYEAQLRKASGATEELSERRLKSFSAQLAITGNQLLIVGRHFMEQFTPALTAMNALVRDGIKWWNGLNPAVQKWLSLLIVSVASIGPIITAVGLLGVVLGAIGTGLVVMSQFLTMFAAIGAAIAGVIYLVGGTEGLASAWKVASDAVGDFALKAAGFLENFQVNMGILHSWLIGVWMAISSDTQAIVSTLLRNLGANILQLGVFIYDVARAFGNAFLTIIKALGNLYLEWFKFLGNLAMVFVVYVQEVYKLIMDLTYYFRQFWITVYNVLNYMGEQIIAYMVGFWTGVYGVFERVFGAIGPLILTTLKTIYEFLDSLGRAILAYIAWFWITVAGVLMKINEAIFAYLKFFWTKVFQVIIATSSIQIYLFQQLWKRMVEALKPIFAQLGKAFSELGEGLNEVFGQIGGAFIQLGKDLGTAFDKLDMKGLMDGLGPLQTPDLKLPEFVLTLPEKVEAAIAPIEGVGKALEEVREDIEEPIKVSFTVSGIEAVEAGTVEALARLNEFNALKDVAVPDPASALNPYQKMVARRKELRDFAVKSSMAIPEEIDDPIARINKRLLGPGWDPATAGRGFGSEVPAMAAKERPFGTDTEWMKIDKRLEALGDKLDAIFGQGEGKPEIIIEPADIAGG